MSRKIITITATVSSLVAGGIFAVPALAAKTPVPAAAQTLVIKASQTSFGSSRTGGPSKSGDTFWFAANLRFNGQNVGTSFSICTLVTRGTAKCSATWDFSAVGSGTLEAAGDAPFSGGSLDDNTLAVIGGTESFEGATGQVDISEDTATKSTDSFDLLDGNGNPN